MGQGLPLHSPFENETRVRNLLVVHNSAIVIKSAVTPEGATEILGTFTRTVSAYKLPSDYVHDLHTKG